MDKLLLKIPTYLEAERLYLRCYQPGDGPWYYTMSQKNRAHLTPFEAENAAMTIKTEKDAEIVVRSLAEEWAARNSFFMGVFDKQSHEFVAQMYIGAVHWDLPEFEVGYFADVDHEGHGYVTEAVKAALSFIFEHLQAHRVRLECDDTNPRSIRVAERSGLPLEGHIRENNRRPDGTISGTLHFGLLRREWEVLSK